MTIGLREFRKKLSEYLPLIKRGQVVVITDRNSPIASFISTDKLREIAKKADDRFVLGQLQEAQADKNTEFIKRKLEFKEEISSRLKIALEGGKKIPNSVITKLQTIVTAIDVLLSEDGTIEDQRMLDSLVRKSRQPLSRVLEYDYFHVHEDFLNRLKAEIELLSTKNKKETIKSSTKSDLKFLRETAENASLRKKTENDDQVTSTCSVLVRISKGDRYYTSRIYTIVPYWYDKPYKANHFIDQSTPLSIRLRGEGIGYKFSHQGYQLEILSVT
ncbi:MAG: hypothetical protein G01um101416_888 [Microgenomates group bacterium Gr01-1014_16]|nr:MAG: hypothetical protein G01um101416_888 [Microgenomates group bacterium Gr01-1014_16]